MNYLDASTETELGAIATVLQAVQGRARTCGVDIMVVGAAARDILIRHVVGSPPQRATRDVDIAVAVNSWSEVACLTSSMGPTPGGAHHFLVLGIEVDVIPFGGIESRDRTITWPDDHEMDVFGVERSPHPKHQRRHRPTVNHSRVQPRTLLRPTLRRPSGLFGPARLRPDSGRGRPHGL